ncbi:transcription initiation factor TFIID subunit 11 [Daktulosphaira vitifoliae]|uniref:transcription initiation factor TFIID subunit 11 n=1 Tax=Daktulosphaira vitifoliae TaxID=58002 RepID=UPI0021A9F6D7|nr:transcription initiation factor TFIID subunit 11 [Daktulosphaira vitifoliae]
MLSRKVVNYNTIKTMFLLLLLLEFRDIDASSTFKSLKNDDASVMWSKFGLIVQHYTDSGDGLQQLTHTTETSGIIIKAPEPTPIIETRSPLTPIKDSHAEAKSWTQISVTPPPRTTSSAIMMASTPIKFSSGFTNTTKDVTSTQPSSSTPVSRMVPSKYRPMDGSSKPVITITFPPPTNTVRPSESTEVTSKRVRQYDDEDDDDDDDDDDDEDEDEYDDDNIKSEEEIEEIVEVQHLDPESYGEEKPTILKKKRRRKKHGKKHKPFKVKDFKKLKKFMLPLLLAYKLKFFTLVPLMLGGLVLIVATTGFAGFFFALFAVGLGLKGGR